MVVSTASWAPPPDWEGRLRSLPCGDRLVCGRGQGFKSVSKVLVGDACSSLPDTCGQLPVPEVYCGFGESLIARTLRGGSP